MAVPKKRKSKQKSRQVKAGGKKRISAVGLQACPNCGLTKLPHRVCSNCGYYNGRIYSFLAKKKKVKAESDQTEEVEEVKSLAGVAEPEENQPEKE